jgi:hypothetical protein
MCNVTQRARSREACCSGKAVSFMYSECVCSLSYPARKAHALYYTVFCGLSGCTIFFASSHKRHDFRRKLRNTESVSIFSKNLSQIFLILRRNLARYHKST